MEPSPDIVADTLDLLDWKREVFALYARVRAAASAEEAWGDWCETRLRLFAEHPQSPRPAEDVASGGLRFFPYDPAFRVSAEVVHAPLRRTPIGSSAGAPVVFSRFARAVFEAAGAEQALDLYWLEAYGGGLFLPFRDATSGRETYGGGRYLLDTVKGADLGTLDGRLLLDFNFAYNPSCCYDPVWVCPLTPPANVLPIAVRAGERIPFNE